ncbi:uncharacterized protein LOC112679892 [Sipha flava]|uniref:Uncharacterized protein LOC112679892 n=1 Tax=Sipha flava TaxID=143950 RepID=A0A8B8F4P3_9HEMI|nr:uncharacterized protein LOC112679892 [Sipha flava]
MYLMSTISTSRKGRPSKRWVVVVFTDAKDFSIVPVNWLGLDLNQITLTEYNLSSIQYCRWPPFKVTSSELLKADNPDETWSLYKIKINNKIYANFKQAWHSQVELETSAAESEEATPKKKKRLSNSYSDESDIEANHQLKIPILSANPNELTTLPSGSNKDHTYSPNRYNQLISPLPTPHYFEPVYEPYVPSSSNNSQYDMHYYNNISTNQMVSDTLIQIQKELISNKFLLKRLLSKVEVLELNSKNNWNSTTTNNNYIDSSFISLFPIRNKEEFLSIENKIINEPDFISMLESFIGSIGGCGTKNNITRVLQKLFNDEFAVIATFTGRGKNILVALGSSEIIKLVKNSEYESVVANWLRHGNTRLSRIKCIK